MEYKEVDYEEESLSKEARLILEQWRDEYYSIYLSVVNDIEFVWRGLSRAEYRKAMEYYDDDFLRAEYVCRLCVLDPVVEDWEAEIPAGIPETITQHILVESGFAEGSTKIKDLQHIHDQEMTRFENQVSCIIKEAFNEFSLEEIDNWPLEKTMWHYSRALWVLRQLRGVPIEEEESPFPGVPNM